MPKKYKKRVPKPMADRKLRSGYERKIRKCLEQKEVDYTYESMVIEYTVPESKHKYVPDFILPNGVIVEGKGYPFGSKDRKKMLYVKEQHPELNIKILFQRDLKISKVSKTKYSDWAKKHGFDYHVSAEGLIPEEWLL